MRNSYTQHYNELLESLEKKSLRRKLKVSESASAPLMTIDGRSMLTFCSNDYLGLANHPQIADAIATGAQRYGSGSGASHMISGHNQAHDELEKALAQTQSSFIPNIKALFFGTGYMANMAAITALSSISDGSNAMGSMSIFSEELNHASLIDGIRLASKQNHAKIHIYPHQNMDALRKMLAEDSNPFKLIVTDGVFSMDGDIAPVEKLLHIAEKYDALLMVDDAHGFGVLGEHGRGILEYANVHSERIIYIGTLGKAAGVSGAFPRC